MEIEDRLSDILTGKKIDCCSKCKNFTKDDDPLDFTGSFGYCKIHDDGVFDFQYCKAFEE